MLCNEVSKRLSEYFDGVLDPETSVEVSRHVKECAGCRRELEGLYALREELRSTQRVPVPDYLYNLVRIRLDESANNTWFKRIKAAVEFRWSRIRTTGIQFYWTKALGIAMAAFCFSFVSNCLDPFYPPGYVPPVAGQYMPREYGEQVVSTISKTFGGIPIDQHLKNMRHYPAIHDGYFNNFWDSVPETTEDEDLSVVTTVEPSGAVKLENVLEYPQDNDVLNNFIDTVTSARGRPGSVKGRSVTLPMVIKAIRITVFSD
jgi:hypothetical protein